MTEKQYAPTKTEKAIAHRPRDKMKDNKKAVDGTMKKQKTEIPIQKTEKENPIETSGKKVEEKTKTKKEVKKPTKNVKKEEVMINIKGVPISTKYSISICKFIKHKPIEKAINDLEEVTKLKKAVPMKGEIPHRKGKIMSGRFPKRAGEHFIVLLKSLLANANNHDVNEPIISEAVANMGSRPYGKRGIKRKRTHIIIRAKSKKLNSKNKIINK
ncbi:MAG: uL22 family ribosomal protein [Nanoarchaeota archaeon]